MNATSDSTSTLQAKTTIFLARREMLVTRFLFLADIKAAGHHKVSEKSRSASAHVQDRRRQHVVPVHEGFPSVKAHLIQHGIGDGGK